MRKMSSSTAKTALVGIAAAGIASTILLFIKALRGESEEVFEPMSDDEKVKAIEFIEWARSLTDEERKKYGIEVTDF